MRLTLIRDQEKLLWNLESTETELWKEPPEPLLEAVSKLVAEIENTGKNHAFSSKVTVEKEDLDQLKALAKEGITSRAEINRLNRDVSYYQGRYYNKQYELDNLYERYEELSEICTPFLEALEHFPDLVKSFVEKVKRLFDERASKKRKEREHRRSS